MNYGQVVTVLSNLRRPFVVSLMLLVVLDGLTTYWGLTTGLSELNPILVASFEEIGLVRTLLISKGASIGILLVYEALATKLEKSYPLTANLMGHLVLIPFLVFYVFVVLNNLILIFG